MAAGLCFISLPHPSGQAQESIFEQVVLSPEKDTGTLDFSASSIQWMQACQTLADLDEALDSLVLKYEPRFKNNARGELELEQALLEMAYGGNENSVSAERRSMLEAQILGEPTLCASLDRDIKNFILQYEPKLTVAVQSFAEIGVIGDEALSIKWIDILNRMRAANAPKHARAQEVLYYCTARNKSLSGAAKGYSVERSMGKWVELQKPMTDAWLGNTD